MLRLAHDAAIADRRRKPHRNRVEGPILHKRFNLSHHLARRHVRPRFEFSPLRARNHHLHIGTANIDNENFFLQFLLDFVTYDTNDSSTLAFVITLTDPDYLVYLTI